MTTSENTETTAEIFARVAPYLGDGWTAREADPDYPSMGGWLDGPNGASLHAYGGYRQGRTDRLAITAQYPDRPDGSRDLPWVNPGPDARKPGRYEITVAKNREPKAIAREIERRLLPQYLEDLELVKAADARAVVAADQQTAAIAELLDAFGLARAEPDGVRWYSSQGATGYGDAKLYHDGSQGSLEVRSVPFSTLRRLLEVLAEVREEELELEEREQFERANTEDEDGA